jgi:hypothetical protein
LRPDSKELSDTIVGALIIAESLDGILSFQHFVTLAAYSGFLDTAAILLGSRGPTSGPLTNLLIGPYLILCLRPLDAIAPIEANLDGLRVRNLPLFLRQT